MSIETTLYSVLTSDDALNALGQGITSPKSMPVFPAHADPKVEPPYITYQVIATEAHNKLEGRPDTEHKVVQINCVTHGDNRYSKAKAIAEAVKHALGESHGYLLGEGDDYFEDTQRFRVRLDWSLIG